MKQLLISLFLPLVLSQDIAMAHTTPQNPVEPETQPASPTATVTNGRTQPSIVPLEGTDQIQLYLVNP